MKQKPSNTNGSAHNRRIFLEHLSVLGISAALLPACTNTTVIDEDNIITLETSNKV